MDLLHSIRGEDLEKILDMMEEDDNDIDYLMSQVEERDGEEAEVLTCKMCQKICKTKSGLANHEKTHEGKDISTKYDQIYKICKKQFKSEAGLSRHTKICQKSLHTKKLEIDDIKELVDIAKRNLNCYPENVGQAIEGYDQADIGKLLTDLKPIVEKFLTKRDSNCFFATYFPKIIMNADEYFPNLKKPMCTLLAKRLGEKILHYLSNNKNSTESCSINNPIPQIEIDGLEYLTGYILRKFYQNAKKQKREKETIILKSFQTNDDEQVFINSINRGGLTAAKRELVNVFIIAEQTFRKETLSHKRKIDSEKIVDTVISNPKALSFFSCLFTECITDEEKNELLKRMIKLFVKVRSFSMAKDIVTKFKRDRNNSFKEKALRKKLKLSHET